MKSNQFHLTIARVDEDVFNGEATLVNVPGVAGDMTILAHHEALISPLKQGVVTIEYGDETRTIEIQSGTLEVSDNKVTILI